MRPMILLASLSLACTSNASKPENSSVESKAPGATGPIESARAPSPDDPCDQRVATYLAEREQLSRCETDSDCAEIWPGLCPHGPYYIHRDADIRAVIALEREIEASCELPECEPPIELGIARCEQGTCVPGRAPASEGDESCWDYRETWLEADGAASATTTSTIRGLTPHLAIAPAAAGTLVLEVDWPAGCGDCRLAISEHNAGMARLITPESTQSDAKRNGQPIRRERLELPVTPGPYHMIATASDDVDYLIRADLRDAEGERGRVTRHGVGWQRMCEG
ncbi:MAG: hypothetical protein R6X02_33270 [Enhygromyxa sp.]